MCAAADSAVRCDAPRMRGARSAPLNRPAADAYYWSRGRKITLLKTPLAVVRRSASSAADSALARAASAAPVPWPQGFAHLARTHMLLNATGAYIRTHADPRQLLPVFNDALGNTFVATDQIVAGLRAGVGAAGAAALAREFGLRVVRYGYPLPAMAVFEVAPDDQARVLDKANALHADPRTRWAHPNFLAPLVKLALVNDPLFSEQWHLLNPGTAVTGMMKLYTHETCVWTSITAGADVNATGAWPMTMGTNSVRICIFDDSVEKDHEDLQPNFVAGLDLDTGANDPSPQDPTEMHGSACAGVAAACANNGVGGCGIAPRSSLMGIRWGAADEAGLAYGFAWARSNQADVISCSWSTWMDDVLDEAISDAADNGRAGRGCAIFFAAGNDDYWIPFYSPARHPKVICVGGSNAEDQRASYSSYGTAMSIVAPTMDYTDDTALGITTTDKMGMGGYGWDNYCHANEWWSGFGGTSSATPLAAGVGALCLAANPALSRLQLKALLETTAVPIAGAHYRYGAVGWNPYLGFGRVNAGAAVAAAPGFTGLPVQTWFAAVHAKGTFNIRTSMVKATIVYDNPLAIYTNNITVALDGDDLYTFDTSWASWKWNKKNGTIKDTVDRARLKMADKQGRTIITVQFNSSWLWYHEVTNTHVTLDVIFDHDTFVRAQPLTDKKGKFKY